MCIRDSAGARVVLQRLDADFLQEVMDKGEYLKQQLLSLPHIKAVNGLGLMRGAVLDEHVQAIDVVKACLQKGLLIFCLLYTSRCVKETDHYSLVKGKL